MLFANLTALTLASCGGGGGGSSAPSPAPSFSFSNQNFTFTEDSSGTFSISVPTNAEGTVSITVNSVPNGISLTASDGTVLSAGSTLSNTLLSGISYTLDENANSELNNFGSLSLTASDGTNSATSSISFTVTAVDDVPVLETSSFSFAEDTASPFDVKIVEVDGDVLTITVESIPTEGTLSLQTEHSLLLEIYSLLKILKV